VQFIQASCTPVIRALEPSLSVKVKDELATALVSVLQSVDAARNFLVDVVMDEVKNEGECRFLFLIFGLYCKPFSAFDTVDWAKGRASDL